MNYTKVATLLRQLADEFDQAAFRARKATSHTETTPVKKAVPIRPGEETVRNILAEDDWPKYNVEFPFGKYVGHSMLDMPINYFKWLSENNFEGRGYDTDDLIYGIIEIVGLKEVEAEEIQSKSKPRPEKPKPARGSSVVDEEVPF